MIRTLHADLAWFVIIGNALAGCWALGAHWLESLRVRQLWIATTVVELSIFVQVALGVVLLSVEDIELDQFHTFYGFVALATVGIIYSYRAQLEPYKYLLYGGGGLFLMGLGLRSMQFSPS
ncbi:hypothetical protein [Actinospongicola halichondriae]|uniref:hypothetical protein n=1 Tax=Actinospongicola halichondriae TaxID=3236844 RepID=UPI003D54BC36